MKRLFYLLLVTVSAFSFSGCRDEDNLPYPKTEEFPVVFTTLTAGSNTYKLTDIAGSGNPVASFSINLQGGDLSAVESLEIYRSFRGFNVAATPAIGTGPRVLFRSVSPASATIEVSLNDVINGLTRATGSSQTGARTPITRASLKENEGFLFTYELLLKDGRRIVYTPLSNGIVSGAQATAPYSGTISIVK